MKRTRLNLFFVLAMVCTACVSAPDTEKPESEPLAFTLCELAPETCSEACRDCADPDTCFKNNGECSTGGRAAATVYYIDDATDGGSDIWTGGCHYSYTDAACTQNRAFHMGDLCGEGNKDALIEWTDAQCHGPKGDVDVFNCDKVCAKLGMGGGTCVVLRGHCGTGRDSAKCQCNPNPT